jgi:hypothetical protein
MRVGDCGVEVIAVGGGQVRELPSGHVLARPGQVYQLRLTNHGPLRGVADVRIDGKPVTAGGLVLEAWTTVDLERPIHATEHGRFTVVAEGDERVFGPDGGRDDPELGVIEVSFRRELPPPQPVFDAPVRVVDPMPFPTAPRSPASPPGIWNRMRGIDVESRGPTPPRAVMLHRAHVEAEPARVTEPPAAAPPAGIERAAGTGLTGHSAQEFRTVRLGPLEQQATVIRLRIVIGEPEAIDAPRPLPDSERAAPARPTARP